MHAVSNNSNLLEWGWLSNTKLCHEQNDRKRCQNDAPTAELLVLSYYYKKCWWSEKQHQTVEKVEMSKMSTVNPLF